MFAGEETDLTLRLHKLGRFVITKGHVITSGRKVRAYSACEILGVLFRSLVRGRKGVEKRDGLELWYAPRRVDPDPDVGNKALATFSQDAGHHDNVAH
jgi:hypothetical protein